MTDRSYYMNNASFVNCKINLRLLRYDLLLYLFASKDNHFYLFFFLVGGLNNFIVHHFIIFILLIVIHGYSSFIINNIKKKREILRDSLSSQILEWCRMETIFLLLNYFWGYLIYSNASFVQIPKNKKLFFLNSKLEIENIKWKFFFLIPNTSKFDFFWIII